MNDSSRAQGGLICLGVVVVAAWFLFALLQRSYWALAIPVAILVFFALGLTFWVGYTIATIQVEPEDEGSPAPTFDSELSDAGAQEIAEGNAGADAGKTPDNPT